MLSFFPFTSTVCPNSFGLIGALRGGECGGGGGGCGSNSSRDISIFVQAKHEPLRFHVATKRPSFRLFCDGGGVGVGRGNIRPVIKKIQQPRRLRYVLNIPLS